jgi:hypothetical protein
MVIASFLHFHSFIKNLSVGTKGMYLQCERNQADDQTIQNDGGDLLQKRGLFTVT